MTYVADKLKLKQYRLPLSLIDRIDEMAEKFETTSSEITRIATDAGVSALEKMDHRAFIALIEEHIRDRKSVV